MVKWTAVVGRWTRVVAIFTAFLVVATIASVWVLYKTDETLKLQQRAWLSPKPLEVPRNFLERKNEYTELAIHYENIGRDPAFNTNAKIGADIILQADWRNETVLNTLIHSLLGNQSCDSIRPSQDGATIFPNVKPGTVVGLSAEKAQRLNQRTHYVLAAGCIAYIAQERPRKTRFCYLLQPNTRDAPTKEDWRTLSCPIHNRSD